MMSKYTVKMGKASHVFEGLDEALAFAQKESWDKARPVKLIKPNGSSMEISINPK